MSSQLLQHTATLPVGSRILTRKTTGARCRFRRLLMAPLPSARQQPLSGCRRRLPSRKKNPYKSYWPFPSFCVLRLFWRLAPHSTNLMVGARKAPLPLGPSGRRRCPVGAFRLPSHLSLERRRLSASWPATRDLPAPGAYLGSSRPTKI